MTRPRARDAEGFNAHLDAFAKQIESCRVRVEEPAETGQPADANEPASVKKKARKKRGETREHVGGDERSEEGAEES